MEPHNTVVYGNASLNHRITVVGKVLQDHLIQPLTKLDYFSSLSLIHQVDHLVMGDQVGQVGPAFREAVPAGPDSLRCPVRHTQRTV